MLSVQCERLSTASSLAVCGVIWQVCKPLGKTWKAVRRSSLEREQNKML